MTYDTGQAKDPEQIKADIERTRRELGHDVDAFAGPVRPGTIVRRQKVKVRSAAYRAKDAVMGAKDSVQNFQEPARQSWPR